MKISYYELLGMIQAGENPKLIKLELNCGERYYKAYYDADEFSHYGLKGEEKENEDFKYYLADTLLESQMIERNIEIIEEEKKIDVLELQENISKLQSEIDLLSNEIGSYHNKIHSMRDRNNYMKETLKDLQKEVRELNKIKKEGK